MSEVDLRQVDTNWDAGASPKWVWCRSRLAAKVFSLDLPESLPPFTSSAIMAIARPIRMLGAACILLTLFLVFQLNNEPQNTTSKLTHGMTRDPLLDRVLPLSHRSSSPYRKRD